MDHKIAIVGATGNVGREMLNILYDKKFKSKNIFPVASSRSAGSKVDFGDEELVVERGASLSRTHLLCCASSLIFLC